MTEGNSSGVRLKRELGLFSAINLILAVMIGSGIFVSPASALRHSGSVGMCLVVWTTCGVISLMGALCFAELGTVVPRSGAEYAYLLDSFGPLHKFWGNLPAFTVAWVHVLILRPAEVAVIVLTFAEYFCQPILDLLCINQPDYEEHIKKIVGILALGVQLKRELGLFSAISFVMSVTIGSGIFVSPAMALRHSGSVGMCVLVWTACGIISLMSALCYAELGTLIPRSGAEYAYLLDSFGPLHKFWGPLPAFVVAWVQVLVLRPAGIAVILLTFAEYFCRPFLDIICVNAAEDAQLYFKRITALLALGIITYINVSSVKLYVKIQNIFSSFKIFACLIVIVGGIYEIAKGNTQNLSKGFEGTSYSPKNIALAFYSGLWAYDGWSAVTTVTEEIKAPEVNIPRSIAISVPIVTLLYVFMNVAYMTVLTIPEMVNAPAVAVVFGERVFGVFSFLIPVGVALSTFGCALSIQFGVTRLCYVASQDGHMLKCLSYVHYERLTPSPSVVMQGIIAFVFIIMGNIAELIDFASFLIWIFYGTAMVSLLILRKTMADVPRPYKVPTPIAVFIILVAIFLSVVPIVTDPSPKYLFAIAFILLGVLVYYMCIYKKKRPKIMDSVTHYVQVLFQVLPPAAHSD